MDVDDMFRASEYERVMTANWTPRHGVRVISSELPDAWLAALNRVGLDLHVRQYGGSIERIDWAADFTRRPR